MIRLQQYLATALIGGATFFGLPSVSSSTAEAQDTGASDANAAEDTVVRPRIFLDKSPRIVEYQLQRLSNEQLLLVEKGIDDPKYLPVFTAILTRDGMSRQDRNEALEGLVAIRNSNPVSEILAALDLLDEDDAAERRTAVQLAAMLLTQPKGALTEKLDSLEAAAQGESSLLGQVGLAGLVAAGNQEKAWELAQASPENRLRFMNAVTLLPRKNMRNGLRDAVIGSLGDDQPLEVRRKAVEAMALLSVDQANNFEKLAPLIKNEQLRNKAVAALLTVPTEFRNSETARSIVKFLVDLAESIGQDERAGDDFVDAFQLSDQLLALLPVDESRSYRERLRAITVRVVKIHTVEEEMRYDTRYFAVEAGRPVQVILVNHDLMPHNMVFTVPGALQEVAELGAILGPNPGFEGKQYVPESDKVLFSTGMVQAGRQEALNFVAPEEPGEYPFVCTFPRHWMRMYGVMVVVEDIDAWAQNPIEPVDPIGSNRSFVQSWSVEDLAGDFESGLRGRSHDIGLKIFAEATCAQCHKLHGMGGAVGPELADVFERYKGDRAAVLREILDPSHKIDPKYAVHVVLTADGNTISGIVVDQTKDAISIVANPESPVPTVIPTAEIDDIVKSSTSMMPKALLDQFTKDEIFELLAMLETAQSEGGHDHSH